MQIIHRVSVAGSADVQGELASFGVVVVGHGLATFEVDESHHSWPVLREWIARRQAADVISTRFSSNEIASAKRLVLLPAWHHGYPQPDELDFGYRRATYDLSDWCDQCGIGLKQKAPFQMKAEPRWGKKGILQLNWVFDEFFVTPQVWSSVFEPHGIGFRPVTNTDGIELKTVVQLRVDEQVGVATHALQVDRSCGTCGRVKYLPFVRGLFPALTSEPSAAMTKTKEYFGSGASAHKRVMISQGLARALSAHKVTGASLYPMAAADTAGGP